MSDNGEKKENILILVDEEGNEHDFALLDRFQVDMNDYAILVPVIYVDENDEEVDVGEDAYIFRIEKNGEEESLVEVEDEAEWSRVAFLWEERARSLDMIDDDQPN